MDDYFKRIQDVLLKKYKNSNQEEIADRAGVSQPTIGRYLCQSKPEYIKAMRLDTFFKLFPDAEIIFDKSQSKVYKEKILVLVEKLSESEQQRAYEVLKLMFSE